MNDLTVNIISHHYPVSRPDIKWIWLRDFLKLEKLKKIDEIENIVLNLNFNVKNNKKVAFLGESGSGKSTLLRIIAGLETNFDGDVTLGKSNITKPCKDIYLMPQNHTLLPWMTVEENLKFNCESSDIVNEILQTFKLANMKNKYPLTLSGGESARIALMCAMCATPKLLLLDEPFRGLDQLTKIQCIKDLSKWFTTMQQDKIVIFVSHDIRDAVYFCDEVYVVDSKPLCIHKHFYCPTNRDRTSIEFDELEAKILSSLKNMSTLIS